MNNDKNFLARWSRRKHGAAADISEQSKLQDTTDNRASEISAASLTSGEPGLSFDPATLPTIDSIGAGSDVRAFLQAGVPADLTRAALRRVWSLDITIRDFVGLSENSWDFNAPDAMPGFGPISKEEVGQLLTRLLGEPDATAAAVHSPLISPSADGSQKQAEESDPVEHRAIDMKSVTLVSTQDQQSDLAKGNVTGDVTQHGRVAVSQHEFTSAERLSPISRRGHGGALPQIP